MNNIFRNVLALLVGVFSGGAVIMCIQMLSARFHPVPPGAFLLVLLSYLVGFTLAIFLAVRLSSSAHARQGILVAMFFGAASVLNLVSLPHPMWFWLANLVVLVIASWLGGILGRPKAKT